MLKHVANLILNTPLLTTPEHAETILSILGDRIDVDASEFQMGDGAQRGGVQVITPSRGTAIIPVVGSLTHRATGLQAASGVPSYASLQAQVEEAMSDSDITSVLLDISSPGGAVSGAFDFRDYLLDQRGRKPIKAIARDTMASAAYLIGSAADEVIATQTARVGSIGVVMLHVDQSKHLSDQGIKPTFIHAGAHKVDGNSAEPLSDEVRADLQAEIDQSYDLFVSAVAEARGMDPAAIRATEARVYSGPDSVQVGLADRIGTLASTIESFAASAPRSYPSMSITGNSEMNEDELRAEGATAERARISAILGSDEAQKRGKQASFLAFKTDMSAEAAVDLMGNSAEEAAAPAEDGAELSALREENAALKAVADSKQAQAIAEMASDGAKIGADAGAGTPEQSAAEKRAEEAAANAARFFGRKK